MNSAGQIASLNLYKIASGPSADWPATFEELYAIYSRRLYRTIAAIAKNPEDAEDALQDTFLRAHLGRETFEGRSSIYSWLTRIAINSALMILRKRDTRAEILFDPQPVDRDEAIYFEVRDSSPNPEEAYDLHHRQLKLLRALGRLDPGLRAPIWLQVMYGRSVKEISRSLNMSEAAVKARLYRARQRLSATHDDLSHFATHRHRPLSALAAHKRHF